MTDYHSQAEAERDIRIALWGDADGNAPWAKRRCLYPDPTNSRWEPPIGVTAVVNGRLVFFRFDNYGRRSRKPEILPRSRR